MIRERAGLESALVFDLVPVPVLALSLTYRFVVSDGWQKRTEAEGGRQRAYPNEMRIGTQ